MSRSSTHSPNPDAITQKLADKDADTIQEFRRKTRLQVTAEFNELDRTERRFTRFYSDNNINRSQFDNVPIYDEEAIRLVGDIDFVHASRILAANERGNYIVAQLPLVRPPEPRVDTQLQWYRMIWAHEVPLCVCLVNLFNTPLCGFFFNQNIRGVHRVGPFKIVTQERVRDFNWNWTYFRLRITNTRASKEDRDRPLQVIMAEDWTNDPRHEEITPRSLMDLLEFAWAIEDDLVQQRRSSSGIRGANRRQMPTIVASRAGRDRAGTYVALSILGREMQQPGANQRPFTLAHVCRTIRDLRSARYDVMVERRHFTLLLSALLEYAARMGLVLREQTMAARRVLQRTDQLIRRNRGRQQQQN